MRTEGLDAWASICRGPLSSWVICTDKPEAGSIKKRKEKDKETLRELEVT